jgi:DNA polymerase zeta
LFQNNYLTVLSVEVHVITRGQLNPDPAVDPIAGIFYSIYNDVPITSNEPTSENGMIVNLEMLMCSRDFQNSSQKGFHVTLVANEVEMFEKLFQLVLLWNPDILSGYEIEKSSWGFLLQRAAAIAVDLNQMLSRIPSEKTDVRMDNGDEREHGEFAELNTDVMFKLQMIF